MTQALQTSAEAGLPAINVTATQGRFLNLLIRLSGARHVLEIGTLGGYSTIWMARALPLSGSLVTLELDAECAAVARANFERAGLADRLDLREGLALEPLSQMDAEKRPPSISSSSTPTRSIIPSISSGPSLIPGPGPSLSRTTWCAEALSSTRRPRARIRISAVSAGWST